VKNSIFILRFLTFVVFLNFLSIPTASANGQHNNMLMTRDGRAANVKQQLLDHQRHVDLTARESKSTLSSAVPSGVSVEFNKLAKTTSSIFFYDNMENGTNGWTVATHSDSAVWHQTTLDANSPTHSWWAGIESQGDYVTGSRVHQELISPLINLTGVTGNVTLLFTENYFTERGFDFCMVDATTDGGTSWTHLRGGYGESPSGDSYGWKVSTLDLTAYANQTVNLRFVFDTGDSLFNAFPGWFIDNVAIFDQSGTVNGVVYYDQNQNGISDVGERGLRNWLVTMAGPLTITMQTTWDGIFSIPLPLGLYQLSEVLQTPWVQTSTPATLSVDLNSPGQEVNDINFGNYRLGCLILGNVFNDLNGDSLFSAGEPPLMDRWIVISDSDNNWVDDIHADSLGQFAFLVFGAGSYSVIEYLPSHWISTIPAGTEPKYFVEVPPRDTVLGGFLFGSYELNTPANSAIHGLVFIDLNRNGVYDDREPAIQDRSVYLLDSNGMYYGIFTPSDTLGKFSFENLTAGKYIVRLEDLCGWHQSIPPGDYSIELDSGQVKDSVMFGSYALLTGSISGTVFNDLDVDAVHDEGELPIGGSLIYLSGSGCSGSVKSSIVSDESGYYRFDGLWAGTYAVRIVMSAHWRQTYPALFLPHIVNLSEEENRTATNFGLSYDSTFNLAFRSFLPETIAYVKDNKNRPGKSVVKKAVASEAIFSLVTPISGLNGLHVEFSQTIDQPSLTVNYFLPPVPDAKFRKWEFKLSGTDTLGEGDSVVIFAVGNVGKQLYISKYWWEKEALTPAPGTSVGRKTLGTGRLLLPMPNVMNVLQAMYSYGLPTKYGLSVGLVPQWHSTYASNDKNVWKSLYEKGHLHVGPPRCIGKYATNLAPIKKSVNGLTPTKGNNILFAEALALKVNIFASDFGITPYGFGSLIFHGDSANPFNELSVRQIAAKLDTSMSQFDDNIRGIHVGGDTCLCDSNYFNLAYRTIRMIDSAFSGQFDTISFGPGLIVKPVRSLSEVPFLTLDSNFSSLAASIVPRRGSYAEEPLQYKLEQNYPNPFNPTTMLSFTLAQESFVTLKIYNILGQEVATLINKEQMDEGTQEIEFDASSFSSGVYLYHIKAESVADEENGIATQTFFAVKKMVLVR
jgi:hypothetical protein